MQAMGHPALNAVTAMDPTIRNLLAHPSQGYDISIDSLSIIRQVPANPSLLVKTT